MSTYIFVKDFKFIMPIWVSKKLRLPLKQAASLEIRIRLEKSLTPHCNNVQSSFSARISTLPCGGEKETQFFPPSEIIIARKTLHKFFKFRRKLGTNSAKLTMSKTKTNTEGSEKKYYKCGQIVLSIFIQMILLWYGSFFVKCQNYQKFSFQNTTAWAVWILRRKRLYDNKTLWNALPFYLSLFSANILFKTHNSQTRPAVIVARVIKQCCFNFQ